jgi:hypothetical protein
MHGCAPGVKLLRKLEREKRRQTDNRLPILYNKFHCHQNDDDDMGTLIYTQECEKAAATAAALSFAFKKLENSTKGPKHKPWMTPYKSWMAYYNEPMEYKQEFGNY